MGRERVVMKIKAILTTEEVWGDESFLVLATEADGKSLSIEDSFFLEVTKDQLPKDWKENMYLDLEVTEDTVLSCNPVLEDGKFKIADQGDLWFFAAIPEDEDIFPNDDQVWASDED